jgi:cytochrome c oxidase subunit 2
MDLVPGTVTYFWFTPTREGRYQILCAELCGIGHHTMRGYVVVESENAFKEWLDTQPTFVQLSADAGHAIESADAGHAIEGVRP